MRSFFILAVFGLIMLQPGVSSAETFNECQARCSADMASNSANCPPFGDEARIYCIKDNQDILKGCLDSCPQAEPADTPADTLADTPPDTPNDIPQDIPLDTPKDTSDTPREN